MSTPLKSPAPLLDLTNIPRRSSRIQKLKSVLGTASPTKEGLSSSQTHLTPPYTHPCGTTNPGNASFSIDQNLRLASSLDEQPPSSGAQLLRETENVDLLVKVFTFLSRLNKTQLRNTCKHWSRRLAGNKPELLYRSFRYVKSLNDMDNDVIASIDRNDGCPSFSEFLENAEQEYVQWKVLPSDSDMRKALEDAGDKIDNCVASNVKESNAVSSTPDFTHSEFARLVLLLRDDEKARNAVYSISQSLTRSALDSGMTRETYWKVIAERFNDPSVKVKFDFDGNLDEIDISKAPVCNRSATVLKEQFQKARPEFMKVLKNWMKSGQNDPERFTDYLSYNHGKLYASSKRAYILFVCCRLGTPYKVDLLVEVATKSIMDGGGCGEGIGGKTRKMSEDDQANGTTESKRRRKSSTDIVGGMDYISRSVAKIGSMVNSFSSECASSKPRKTTLDLMEEEEELYEKLEKTYEALERAKARNDSIMLQFATSRHNYAIANYERFLEKKEVNE